MAANIFANFDYHQFFLSIHFMASFGLLMGVLAGFVMYRSAYSFTIFGATSQGEDWISDAQSHFDLQELERKERGLEIESEIWSKLEPELLSLEEKIEELSDIVQEKKQKADDRYSQDRQRLSQKEQNVKRIDDQHREHQKTLSTKEEEVKNMRRDLVAKLSDVSQVSGLTLIEEIKTKLINESQRFWQNYPEKVEAETKEHAEVMAKTILDRVYARFQRVAPVERGIAPVYFEDEERKNNFFKLDPHFVKEIQEVCGCDIVSDPQLDLIGVAGFDPVRRELTRRVLERVLKENKPGPKNPVTSDWLKKVSTNIKTEILRLIKHDGDAIAKELRIEGLHPEIRQVMGSLKYRYSFTQNQYFHCGEVGFLCGLLASELRTGDARKARRSGLLHDLGKAMDHQVDGGHAVIGADFIEARGEAPDIVHAVRAHHYDEDPSTDMAFLVIAADAISGARPGARRSTVETYNQKVTELQEIARSFPGVTDCLILSGGREARVYVNNRRVDDMAALRLSKEIATRVEAECNYPGQIKIVVIRETIVTEQTLKVS